MKRTHFYLIIIFFCTLLPIFLAIMADQLNSHYTFIWFIFIIPNNLIVVLFPKWRAVLGSAIFYSFLMYTMEQSEFSEFTTIQMTAQILSAIVYWSISLNVAYFIIKSDKLLQRLEKMSLTDPLTGLYNRRYFNLFMEQADLLDKRPSAPLIFIMLDIDYFKKINDTYGHLCGDFALKHVAEIIKSHVRESDASIRIGGEEFAILLPETVLEEGEKIAERIRKTIEETAFVYNDEHIPITISVGLSTYQGEIIDDFFDKTDQALYQAKVNGRNQLVVSNGGY